MEKNKTKYENGFYLQVLANGDRDIIENSSGEWSSIGSSGIDYDNDIESESVALYRIDKIIDVDGNIIYLLK